jgi:hypothetical protein
MKDSKDWLDDQKREHKMTWISVLAGTRKHAPAQTSAEFCAERRRLGAAVFLFRPSGLTDPNTVIPSIAYQLASTVSEHRSLLTQYMPNDLRNPLAYSWKILRLSHCHYVKSLK